MNSDTALVIVTAIAALTAINIVALLQGIDAQLTNSIAALIGGLVGYYVRKRLGERGG